MSIFYSAILLNFKALYLELQSEFQAPCFVFGESILVGVSFC